MSKPYIRVAAGLILDERGHLLLGQRPAGKPWAGWWELPGGKIEAGESIKQALVRELHEELGIRATQIYPWVTHIHEYPKNIVELAFCQVTAWEGTPQGLENQDLAWVDPQDPIDVGPLLPATEPPLRWLQLPTRYLISHIVTPEGVQPFMVRLKAALTTGLRLVQFREPNWTGAPDALYEIFRDIVALCHGHGAQCLINSAHPATWWAQADGVHLRAVDAQRLAAKGARQHPNGLLGVSAHNPEEIQVARTLNADFIVLGHVLDTPSHAEDAAIGWDQFEQWAALAGRPVFALGGQSVDTAQTARQHGAHGIAAIRGPIL
ncbi:Nudix family hydrolase [Alcaligenaceae bacterium CGII-47]|nr:Nudix family hydrolase [Alcaligenaceae bacterium CGII-47]